MAKKSMSKQLSQSKQIEQNAERTDFLYNRQNEIEPQVKANTGLLKELETTKADQTELVDLQREYALLRERHETLEHRFKSYIGLPWWKRVRGCAK